MTNATRIRRSRTTPPGHTFEPMGSCRRCGQCCYLHNTNPGLWGSLPESPLGEDTRMGTNEDQSATTVIEDRCYRHGEDNLCTIYGDRPGPCRAWPEHPDQLLPGCGYWFLELDVMGKLFAVHRPDPRGP